MCVRVWREGGGGGGAYFGKDASVSKRLDII